MAEVINGSDLYVFIGGSVVAHATSHTLSMKMNVRDTSNKDTGKFNTKAVGRMDVSATADALVVYNDLSTLMTAYLARTAVAVGFGERSGAVLVDGEYVGGALDTTTFYAQGNFIITGLDLNAGDQENASYSVSFENSDATFTFSGEGALRAFIVQQNCTANAADDGAVLVIPSGGTAPYTFSWDTTPATLTQGMEALPPDTYTVTVTDAAAATTTATCTITEPAP
jgi:archaellum component FlaG (FlaF/FlaG flagellin family)